MKNEKLKIENEDPRINNFIQAEIAHCKQNKIKIELVDEESVEVNGGACSGYFIDSPKPKIVVATGKSFEEWLPILIHESCHKDQWLEKDPNWTASIKEHFDANDILDMWLNHAVELKPKQLSKVISQVIALELDCEQRAVRKIQQHDLPISIEQYTQKANAYVWQHRVVQKTRSWGKDTAYSNEKLWGNMPVDFCDSYAKISNKMFKLFVKHCG
jgi:hypothetical protein